MDNSIKEYERPAVTADVVLFRVKNAKLQIALIQRDAGGIEGGKWSIPGGFVDIKDTIRDTIYGKVADKIGTTAFEIFPLTIKDNPERDERWRVISCVYAGLLHPNNNDNADHACRWCDIQEVPPLAFDHNEMVREAIEWLREGVDTYAYRLVPDTFVISELKTVYEAILGTHLNNFARRAKKHIAPTGKTTTGVAHRPAAIYQTKNKTNDTQEV